MNACMHVCIYACENVCMFVFIYCYMHVDVFVFFLDALATFSSSKEPNGNKVWQKWTP